MAEIAVFLSLAYLLGLFTLSRRRRAEVLPAPEDLLFAFVIPCLNEEAVIARTLDNLVPLLSGDDLVLVIDDGLTTRRPSSCGRTTRRACTSCAASCPTRGRARARR